MKRISNGVTINDNSSVSPKESPPLNMIQIILFFAEFSLIFSENSENIIHTINKTMTIVNMYTIARKRLASVGVAVSMLRFAKDVINAANATNNIV